MKIFHVNLLSCHIEILSTTETLKHKIRKCQIKWLSGQEIATEGMETDKKTKFQNVFIVWICKKVKTELIPNNVNFDWFLKKILRY